MDTKSLYDWANEAGLNFKDEDGYHDAIPVWVDGIMSDPDSLEDIWLDWLVEITEQRDKEGKPDKTDWHRLVSSMGDNHKARHQTLRMAKMDDPTYMGSFCTAVNMSGSHAFDMIYRYLLQGAQALVEESAEEWWADVCSYDYDMRAGAEEDYRYEQYRDRKLEERYEG